MDNFDPIDDLDEYTVRMNAQRRERLAEERRVDAARAQAEAMAIGEVEDVCRRAGLTEARVTIHPHGTFLIPGRRRKREPIDVTPPVTDLRFWNGFEPHPGPVRHAVDELAREFGSLRDALGLCAMETAGRWRTVVERTPQAKTPEEAAHWRALALRGVSAIQSEARYRKKVSLA
ncbi:hypothetical protein [Sulfitobacter sp. 1A15106]|uniref:hypothetical protein n=1 Tax=Sulfitobacter sp. 1A15106 TaxID=3368590 RepID=UPI0037456700